METLLETTKIPFMFTCNACDYITCNKKDFKKHLVTRKHIGNLQETVIIEKSQLHNRSELYQIEKSPQHNEISPQYEVIDIYIDEKSQPDIQLDPDTPDDHINKSPKHNITINTQEGKSQQQSVTIHKYKTCPNCNKEYSGKSGLWKHKQKCISKESKENELRNTIQESTNDIKMNMIMTLINKNTEIQNFLFEQNKKLMEQNAELYKVNHTTNSNNNNINSNNSFNLSFFLNEQCKNAVNMNDFISSLAVTIEDLERTGKLGYVEGITTILLNGLKEMDMYTRPIHCSDLKREILYLKNQDKWEKDDDKKTNFKKAIKSAAIKNLKQLPKWREENPDCEDMNSEASDVFVVISQKAMGGMDAKEEEKFHNSITKNILRNVTIEGKP